MLASVVGKTILYYGRRRKKALTAPDKMYTKHKSNLVYSLSIVRVDIRLLDNSLQRQALYRIVWTVPC